MIQQILFSGERSSESSWFAEAIDALSLSEFPGWPDRFGDLLIEWNRNNIKRNIRVLSLFSGAGGLDIGFHDAGFKIVECNEIEKDFAATLSLNSLPDKRLDGYKVACIDINDYYPEVNNIDFIIGGPPCQTFSAAGARAAGVNGTDDDRGNLFRQYVRILDKLKPKGFLFENVYRIVGAQKGKPWKQIQDAFREVGYKLYWRIIDAADFGVPQFRERLIIVGIKEGTFQFPYPTHGPDSTDNRPYYSAAAAIKGVISKVPGSKVGGRHGYLLDNIPPGLNYSFYTDRMGHPTPHFGWRSKFSDYLYKADPNTPVRTIKAQGGQYTGPFHWENRTFTIEELKRLQTFPDSYMINGNRQKIIHQIGNSVPPQLARILALSIAQQVFGLPLPFKLKLLPESFELGFRTRKSKLTKIYAQKAANAIKKMGIDKPATKKIIKSKKEYFRLINNFVLEKSNQNTCWDYYFESEISNGNMYIQLWDKEKSKDAEYQYTVTPISNFKANSGIELITMKSFSISISSITAIWKYLESLVRIYYHKDDLVQLFGYYQYSNHYSIDLEYINKTLETDAFWKILKKITTMNIVGKILRISDISELYNAREKTLFTQFKKLKSLGFEIRNNNTNRQIEKGYFLIPYCFPSLNERSLQRLTEL
ncbi:DNA-cytosine methyltransferase [Desulfonema limicola]|uniref:Cytosine-specific methyltransferase n=1 Tax=Desulfonema limicola TaxID=45656 RepID=A0A975B9C1_9BACT|nr:DNA cytosine methyltransferase [Desulfonema limicola]QTA80975.1 DNA-cytosine methyltransferase [Desulfonema limicola]